MRNIIDFILMFSPPSEIKWRLLDAADDLSVTLNENINRSTQRLVTFEMLQAVIAE